MPDVGRFFSVGLASRLTPTSEDVGDASHGNTLAAGRLIALSW